LFELSGITKIGFIPCQKAKMNITKAMIRFIITHAESMINFCQKGFECILSLSYISESFDKSSHFGLIKPHKGSAFKVYSVHFLSLYKVLILGGIQSQNS